MRPIEGVEVVADVLADGGVRAAPGLDRGDLVGGQGLVAVEELGVLAREDVVGDDPEPELVTQRTTEREQERRLPTPDGAADAHGERTRAEVSADTGRPCAKKTGVEEGLVRVPVSTVVWHVTSRIYDKKSRA
jgi:hypothetical protein